MQKFWGESAEGIWNVEVNRIILALLKTKRERVIPNLFRNPALLILRDF